MKLLQELDPEGVNLRSKYFKRRRYYSKVSCNVYYCVVCVIIIVINYL